MGTFTFWTFSFGIIKCHWFYKKVTQWGEVPHHGRVQEEAERLPQVHSQVIRHRRHIQQGSLGNWGKEQTCCRFLGTTLQSRMNAKLSKQRFWHCHEKIIQTIPQNLHVSVKLTSLHCGWRLILILSKGKMTWHSPIVWGIVWNVLMSPFLWQCQNLCLLSLAFIIDWRVVGTI